MSRTGTMPELRIAAANFGPGGLDQASADRRDIAMRWDETISVLRRWQPHIVLCRQISAATPGALRAELWITANTLGMIPLPGPPTPGLAMGTHPAVLVAASAGLMILDASPGWQSGAAQPAWCEALVQVPGWAHVLRAYSVDLPGRSSVEQRSQADLLASRIGELAGLGELAVAGGNWNSYGRAEAFIPSALHFAPLHLRPSRMRYSPQDGALTPNYDVHDVLACVGMEEAAAVLPPEPHDVSSGEPGVLGRAERIYLMRDLAGAVAGNVQQDMRNSEYQALMLTLAGAGIVRASSSGR